MSPANISNSSLDSTPVVTAKPKSKRIYELDGIRALAALNLLLFHFTWVYHAKYGFESPIFGMMFPYGKYGVAMFFMLSGFVNAFTLIRKKPTSSDFVAGRAIRILPSYWLVILSNVFLLSSFSMFGHSVTATSTLANATVMPKLFGFENMEPVTWTLMIELLFYGFLLFALYTGRLARPMFGLMMTVVGICFCGALANQFIQSNMAGTQLASISSFVDEVLLFRWMPLFSMGILLNEIKMKRGSNYLNAFGILVSAIVFHAVDVKDHNPVMMAGMFGMLALSAYGKLPILRFKPLLFVGTISYSLYLFHNNIGTLLMSSLEQIGVYPLVSFFITFAFVIAMSAAITFWFEQPVTRFLRKLWQDCRESQSSFSETVSRIKEVTAEILFPRTKQRKPVPVRSIRTKRM